VIYFRVLDPRVAILEVSNFLYATSQLAQTTLRSVLGEVDLDTLLSQREKLNVRLQSILDQQHLALGVKVTMVEVKQVDLAESMIRVIARQRRPNASGAPRSSCRRRVHGRGEAGHGRESDSEAARRASIALPPDAGRDRRREEHHHRVPLPLDIITSLGRAWTAQARSQRLLRQSLKP